MKIKITPSLKRTPPGISNLPHLSQLTIQSLRSNAFRLAGCVYEISKWTLDTCFLPDSGEVEFCNVIAQHNGECIYGGDLDDALEKAVSTIVGFDVQLTEGGEQDDGIAVFA